MMSEAANVGTTVIMNVRIEDMYDKGGSVRSGFASSDGVRGKRLEVLGCGKRGKREATHLRCSTPNGSPSVF